MIELTKTEENFVYGEFADLYGQLCSISESSLAKEDAIWLGVDQKRMLLSREMAADLIPLLQRFVDTGELK